jgi:phage terminase Nu1 subunit (DNA packaging protein)
VTAVIVTTPAELAAIVADAVAAGIARANAATAPTEYVSPSGLAGHMAVSRATVHRWLHDGLPCIGRGKSRRIAVADADAWLRDRPVQVASDDAATKAAHKLSRTR